MSTRSQIRKTEAAVRAAFTTLDLNDFEDVLLRRAFVTRSPPHVLRGAYRSALRFARSEVASREFLPHGGVMAKQPVCPRRTVVPVSRGSGAKLARRLGGWCWRRVLRVVAWCREPVGRSSLSSGSLDARKARVQRQRDRRLQGRSARRVEGHAADVPVFEVVKCMSRLPTIHQCQSWSLLLLVKFGLQGLRCTGPRQLLKEVARGGSTGIRFSRQIPGAGLRAACLAFQRWWRRLSSTLERRVRRRIAEQIVDIPALPDVEGPVFVACRRGAGKRLSSSVARPRGAGRRLSSRVASLREYEVLHGRY